MTLTSVLSARGRREKTPKFSDVCMILMTADNDGTGCGALAAAEQVQSKIVLLDGEEPPL